MICDAVQHNLLKPFGGNSGLHPNCIATPFGFFIGDNTMKTIQNFPGYYVTKEGNVYSDRQRIVKKLLKLKLVTNLDGYLIVSLYRDKRRFQGKVHRLVAEAFLDNRPEGKCLVRHLDGNPTNNNVSNLRWGTPQENSVDMVKHHRSLKGKKNHAAKLTSEQVLMIRQTIKTGNITQQAIADNFGITKGHVNNIVKRRVWKHV